MIWNLAPHMVGTTDGRKVDTSGITPRDKILISSPEWSLPDGAYVGNGHGGTQFHISGSRIIRDGLGTLLLDLDPDEEDALHLSRNCALSMSLSSMACEGDDDFMRDPDGFRTILAGSLQSLFAIPADQWAWFGIVPPAKS